MTFGGHTIVDRSLLSHQWILREADENTKTSLSQAHHLPDIVIQLLAARGVKVDQVADFLDPKIKNLMPDPYHLLGMKEAVERIISALDQQKPIGIIGDYDVDGACSSAILSDFLKKLGAIVHVRIPDRVRDGYGPSVPLIDELKDKKVELILTLDCGSMSFEPLAYARGQGIDVIVIDHHGMLDVMPEALAIINPKRRDQQTDVQILCAAGVTFLAMVALASHVRRLGGSPPDLMSYVDRVALATVCDVVPLLGINRALVKTGLKQMNLNACVGIKTLASTLGISKDIDAYHLGYVLGPHINAGGRVGVADLGFRLLATHEASEAQQLAELAMAQNALRKQVEARALHEAEAIAQEKMIQNRDFLVLYNPQWHIGILGIIASRIKEKTKRPVVVLGDCGSFVKGSARSIETIDIGSLIHEAQARNIVSAGGGHAMAAGMSLNREQIPLLESFLNEAIRDYTITPKLWVDAQVAVPALQEDLFQKAESLAPFGADNPAPLLYVERLKPIFARIVGEKHIQVRLADTWGNEIQGIAFQAVGTPLEGALLNKASPPLHCLGHLQMNLWNGKKTPQFQITDVSFAA